MQWSTHAPHYLDPKAMRQTCVNKQVNVAPLLVLLQHTFPEALGRIKLLWLRTDMQV